MTANNHDYLYNILEAHVAQFYKTPAVMQTQLTDLLFATFAPTAVDEAPAADVLPVEAPQTVDVDAAYAVIAERVMRPEPFKSPPHVPIAAMPVEAPAVETPALTQAIPGTTFPPLSPTAELSAEGLEAFEELTEAANADLDQWLADHNTVPISIEDAVKIVVTVPSDPVPMEETPAQSVPVPAPAPILTGTDAAKQKAKDYIFDCLQKKEGVDSHAIHGLTGMESSDVRKFITACQDEYTQSLKRKPGSRVERQEAGISALIAAIHDTEEDDEEEGDEEEAPDAVKPTNPAKLQKRGGWSHTPETKAAMSAKATARQAAKRAAATTYTNGGAHG